MKKIAWAVFTKRGHHVTNDDDLIICANEKGAKFQAESFGNYDCEDYIVGKVTLIIKRPNPIPRRTRRKS